MADATSSGDAATTNNASARHASPPQRQPDLPPGEDTSSGSADDVGISVTSLSSDPRFPCVLLRLPRLSILLDCALDHTTMMNFVPLEIIPSGTLLGSVWHGATQKPVGGGPPTVLHSVRSVDGHVLLHEPLEYRLPRFELVDTSSIDVVLISNCHTLLALPYLTERTSFSGVVYATEPTLRFGAHLMEAMTAHDTEAPRRPSRHGWKVPDVLAALSGHSLDAPLWRRLYTAEEAAAAVARCTIVSYGEKIDAMGLARITAHASGYGIGAANWVVQTTGKRIVYVAPSSNSGNRHPKMFDVAPLLGADLCIMSGLAAPIASPPDHMAAELLSFVVSACAAGGTALLPVHSAGVVLDLIELVVARLAEAQLTTVPIFFVSPSAKGSLSYANICGEWLCESKAEKVLMPEWPFRHADNVSTGVLQLFPALTPEFSKAYREPCVIFADQPSLRSGPALGLLPMLSGRPESVCVLSCPDYGFEETIAPHRRAGVRFQHCPIDPALLAAEARGIAARLAPKRLAMPAGSPRIECRSAGPTIELALGVTRRVTEVTYENAVLSESLASSLTPVQVDHDTAVVGLTATLDRRDYRYRLDVPTAASAAKKRRILLGSPHTASVVQALAQRGFRDVAVEQLESSDVIHLASFNASIILSRGKTDIVVKNNETLRQALRDSILSLLTEL